jgi:uncharacterized protein YraI
VKNLFRMDRWEAPRRAVPGGEFWKNRLTGSEALAALRKVAPLGEEVVNSPTGRRFAIGGMAVLAGLGAVAIVLAGPFGEEPGTVAARHAMFAKAAVTGDALLPEEKAGLAVEVSGKAARPGGGKAPVAVADSPKPSLVAASVTAFDPVPPAAAQAPDAIGANAVDDIEVSALDDTNPRWALPGAKIPTAKDALASPEPGSDAVETASLGDAERLPRETSSAVESDSTFTGAIRRDGQQTLARQDEAVPAEELEESQVAAVDPEEEAQPEPDPARPAASGSSARVNSDVNMRAGRDNGAAVVTVVPNGATVELISCKVWCEISYEGKRGFIFKGFVSGKSGGKRQQAAAPRSPKKKSVAVSRRKAAPAEKKQAVAAADTKTEAATAEEASPKNMPEMAGGISTPQIVPAQHSFQQAVQRK